MFEVVFNSVILLLFLLLCMVGVKCELFVSLLFFFLCVSWPVDSFALIFIVCVGLLLIVQE